MPKARADKKQPIMMSLRPRVRQLLQELADREDTSMAEIAANAILTYAVSKGLRA